MSSAGHPTEDLGVNFGVAALMSTQKGKEFCTGNLRTEYSNLGTINYTHE